MAARSQRSVNLLITKFLSRAFHLDFPAPRSKQDCCDGNILFSIFLLPLVCSGAAFGFERFGASVGGHPR